MVIISMYDFNRTLILENEKLLHQIIKLKLKSLMQQIIDFLKQTIKFYFVM
jgi:hypothetical protein